MEVIKNMRIKLRVETNKRAVEKDLGSPLDLRWFMNDFFSSVAERRFSKKAVKYVWPERRMPLWEKSAQE